MASDHSFESCIHFSIKTDVQPGVYGTVSLTKPIDKVDSNGVPSYFSCHCNVHVKHLHGKPADRKNHHNNNERSNNFFPWNLFIWLESGRFKLTRNFVEPYLSRNYDGQDRDDGKRYDVVDEQ